MRPVPSFAHSLLDTLLPLIVTGAGAFQFLSLALLALTL